MNRENCNDRDGNNHFGEYGFYDGYISSSGNCRVGLKTRNGSCADADLCVEECQKRIRENGKNNIISICILNMNRGERLKQKEISEDKEMAAIKRAKEKEEAQKLKEEMEQKKDENISNQDKKEVENKPPDEGQTKQETNVKS